MNKPADNYVPLVSVVMAVYNGGHFLRAAVDSILEQTFRDFEFIIIDDGSTDDSAKLIKSYSDSRIRLIGQKNHGLVYTLNRGISLARGQFIARMDADDISLPTRFEKEVAWLSKDPHRGLVSTYFSMVGHDDGKPLGINLVFPPTHIDLRRTMYIKNPFPHGACMFRKEAVEDLCLYRSDYGPAEDYELWRRMAERWEVGLVPEMLFWYRINNPDSISQRSSDEQTHYVEKIRLEEWLKPFVAKNAWRIMKDLHRLKGQIGPEYAKAVGSEYKSEQFLLTKELLLRGKLKNAMVQFTGTFLIMPLISLRLLRYIPHGILLGMKVQLRRIVR